MMNKGLKPCPSCGSEAITQKIERNSLEYVEYGVTCTKCNMQVLMPDYDYDKAIENWNKRVTDEINPK